jgi:hypothetical protein
MQKRFIYQGKEYKSIEEMPDEARAAFERIMADNNKDGMPDMFDSATADYSGHDKTYSVKNEYVINGKKYQSLDEVPENLRRLVEPLFEADFSIDKFKNINESISDIEDAQQSDDEIFWDKLMSTPVGPARDRLIEEERTRRRYQKMSVRRTTTVSAGSRHWIGLIKMLGSTALLTALIWWFFFR